MATKPTFPIPLGATLSLNASLVEGFIKVEYNGLELFSSSTPTQVFEVKAQPVGAARIDMTGTKSGNKPLRVVLAWSVEAAGKKTLISQLELSDTEPGKTLRLTITP